MKDRTGCIIILLCMIGLANLAGIYFIIDSNSRFTQALAKNETALSDLREHLKDIRLAPENTNTGNQTRTITTDEEFANQEFYQPQQEDGGKRVSYVTQFSGNLNYLIRNESTTSAVWRIINDEIATRNLVQTDKFEPVMAEKWTVSDDGLVYTITLKKGIMWHPYTDPMTKEEIPAKEVTTDDFIFYWEVLQNTDIPCDASRVYFKLVKTIEAIDRYSFRIVWSEPYSKGEELSLTLSPLPRHYYRPNPDWSDKEFAQQFISSVRNQYAVGCGPYRLASWRKGHSMVFERYEKYYGPKPAIKTRIIRVIPEPSIALVELQKGGIDAMGLTSEQWVKETTGKEYHTVTPDIKTGVEDSAEWDDLKQAGKTPKDYQFEKFQFFGERNGWSYIAWNLKKPIFQDKRTRQALTMLTDRQKILKEVFYDLGMLMAGPFTPYSDYSDPAVKPFPFDPAAAKKLLAEAGWKDSDNDGVLDIMIDSKKIDFKFSLMIPSSSPTARKMVSIIQADMRKVGVDMNIRPIEWSVFIDRLDKRQFEACSLGWTGELEPDPYQIWHSDYADTEYSSNFIGYKNKRVDELIHQGRREIDRAKRMKLYRELFTIIHDEQPYTFLFATSSLVVQNKKFYNARVYPLDMDSNIQWIPRRMQK